MGNNINTRIATSEAGLATGALFARKIPKPQTFYRDHSSRSSQGEGGEARHGYLNVSLLWDTLTASQASALKAVITAAQGQSSGLMYLTIRRTDATNGDTDWIDVSGRPLMPEFQSSNDGRIFRNVELTINNLTILNDPSTYN